MRPSIRGVQAGIMLKRMKESHLGSAAVSIIRDDPESSHKHVRKHVGDGTVPGLKGSRDGLIISEWLLLFSQGIH